MRTAHTAAISAAALLISGMAFGQVVGAAKVETRERQPYGRYLTDGDGRAVYMFTADAKGSTTCYERCADAWPPLLTAEKPLAGPQVTKDMLGTLKRKDGRVQVTYNGLPLYYYTKDKGPSVATGQDVKDSGGEWYLMSPDGKPIKKDPPALPGQKS